MDSKVAKSQNNEFLVKIGLEIISLVIWLTGGVLIILGVILFQLFMVDYFFIKNFIYLLSIMNILIGSVLFVCGIMSLYYALKKHFLIGGIVFYILILIALSILVLTVIGIVLYHNGTIQKYSNKNLVQNFANSSHFVDKLQTNFMCCGLNSYTEWSQNPNVNTIGQIAEFYLSQDRLAYSLPDSCCIKKEINCAKYFPSVKIIHKQPCQPVLDKLLHNLLKQMMFISFISLIIILCSIFFISYASLFSQSSYHVLERKKKKSSNDNNSNSSSNNNNESIKNDEYTSSESALLDDDY